MLAHINNNLPYIVLGAIAIVAGKWRLPCFLVTFTMRRPTAKRRKNLQKGKKVPRQRWPEKNSTSVLSLKVKEVFKNFLEIHRFSISNLIENARNACFLLLLDQSPAAVFLLRLSRV